VARRRRPSTTARTSGLKPRDPSSSPAPLLPLLPPHLLPLPPSHSPSHSPSRSPVQVPSSPSPWRTARGCGAGGRWAGASGAVYQGPPEGGGCPTGRALSTQRGAPGGPRRHPAGTPQGHTEGGHGDCRTKGGQERPARHACAPGLGNRVQGWARGCGVGTPAANTGHGSCAPGVPGVSPGQRFAPALCGVTLECVHTWTAQRGRDSAKGVACLHSCPLPKGTEVQTHLAFGGGCGVGQELGQGVQHRFWGNSKGAPVSQDPCEGQGRSPAWHPGHRRGRERISQGLGLGLMGPRASESL